MKNLPFAFASWSVALLAGCLAQVTLAENSTAPKMPVREVRSVEITSVQPRRATPSSPVTITGAGFGSKHGGFVSIGGQRAWTTLWTDTQIVAYIPEITASGAVQLQIAAGNSLLTGPSLAIESRPAAQAATAQGSVAWRFEMLANYISHRADVGRDGTVYVNDSQGILYAINPDGSLKWVYDGGGSGSQGPTVVGRDGTIYFGIAGVQSAIHAVNPDGTRKWIFVAPQSQGPIGGPNIGPDGNIYAVFDLPGTFGAVSLTPDGTLRWNAPGNPRISEYGQTGKELVFGGGNVYWDTTYFGDFYAFDLLTGAQRWVINLARPGQAVAARKGTVFVPTGIAPTLNAYSKNGQLRWTFLGNEGTTTNVLSAPDLGRDGNIYIDRNLSELYSLTPAPSTRWISQSLLPQGPVPGPIVSPTNEVVLIGGQQTYGQPGLIQGFSTVDGALLFEIALPLEPDGTCAVPYARARFTRLGERAYIPAAQLCEVPDQYHSWLYAIDIAP